ncbi:unnamed protein product, partial [Phaeothamnion confervicola]
TNDHEHLVSIVVPVYRGEATIEELVDELLPFTTTSTTPDGRRMRIVEILLVNDNGPDRSGDIIRRLAERSEIVHPIWLARNSGQHAATAAGIASSGAEWVVTMDEDGQHAAGDIGRLIDCAVRERVNLVYGRQVGGAPHRWWRNASSSAAKRIARSLVGSDSSAFTSFRLIEGTRARAVTAYIGSRTFLDSALSWAIDRSVVCEVTRRGEWRAGSGYNLRRLLSHFWTLVLSSGTRPLRLVSGLGTLTALSGFVFAGII